MESHKVYAEESYAPKPPYAMLSENGGSNIQPPPPYRRDVPRYPSKHKRSVRACACRCLCCLCCCSCIFFFIFALVVSSLYALYVTYEPQFPSYNVQGLQVEAFDLLPDFSLHAEFAVAVGARNPNRRLCVIYGGANSFVSVLYEGSELCGGKVPKFRLVNRNTTVMDVRLKGGQPIWVRAAGGADGEQGIEEDSAGGVRGSSGDDRRGWDGWGVWAVSGEGGLQPGGGQSFVE